MAKIEWMKYSLDQASADLAGASLAEEGAYHRAARHCFNLGPLPEERLRRMCGEGWDFVKPLMVRDGDGLIIPWVKDSREAVIRHYDQRAAAGKKSAESRTTVQRPLNDRSTVVLSISDSSSLSGFESPLNENLNVKNAREPEIVMPWDSDDFKAAWGLWKRYKAERRQYYKPIGEQAALRRLSKVYPSAADAIEAIEFSIAQNYQGIYSQTKNSSNGGPTQKQRTDAVMDATARLLARRRAEREYREGLDGDQHQGGPDDAYAPAGAEDNGAGGADR